MVRVMPCLPTIGKIKLILDDVFKLSRWLGTYPIDEEYSSISKLNLAKGVILYFLASVIATESLYGRLTVEDVPLSTIITQLLRILPIIILHWINLACLVSNRKLAKVKKTNKMLYRRLLNNLDDEILQFHLVAKRDIVFTANGFFILESTLICTVRECS
ncbi:unnamed protein product [Nezara viridula]|uniref:Uncharacterized protein n=1 Tax=Nezara viridula TaxID=85310 RepID=A0A9P0HK65_NEZVI|nr:unnamed protein product [Nezara viridula]